MKFKENYLSNYLKEAPVSLALERSLECNILSERTFHRPILDIGCGEGLFASILFDEKIDVGIDPNEKELTKAKEYGMYEELIQCYGNKIPKDSGSFNTIFSNSVIEHIPDIGPLLTEIYRLLSPQGNLYFTCPTNFFDHYSLMYQALSLLKMKGLAERFRVFYNRFWRHYHYYTQEGWTELFDEHGFEVVEVHQYGRKNVCLLDDMFAYLSLSSFLSKKFFNRWFLMKQFRSTYSGMLDVLLQPVIDNAGYKSKNCGLIFFSLKKSL